MTRLILPPLRRTAKDAEAFARVVHGPSVTFACPGIGRITIDLAKHIDAALAKPSGFPILRAAAEGRRTP